MGTKTRTAKTTNRTPKGRDARAYRGESVGAPLAKWLNGENEDRFDKSNEESRSNVLWVIKTICEIESFAAKYGPAEGWKEEPTEVLHLERLLTMVLSDYTFHPGFNWNRERGFEWGDFNTGDRPAEETWKIRAVVDLSEAGLLDRIRKCSCNLWFFARFPHQISHSSKCRRNLYEKTDLYRAHRKRKAREYYWLHKTKNTK